MSKEKRIMRNEERWNAGMMDNWINGMMVTVIRKEYREMRNEEKEKIECWNDG